MEKEQKTKNERQRKALLVLPLVVVPFLALAFWSLGGGKGTPGNKKGQPAGLNVHLPDPQLKEGKGQDKLSFYRDAEKEAAKMEAGLDRYLPVPDVPERNHFDPAPYLPGEGEDPNEEKVYRKLEQLQRRLQAQPARKQTPIYPHAQALPPTFPLEREGPPLRPEQEGADPELAQLNAMMDKILDIQHPERVKEKARPAATKGAAVYTVTKGETGANITLLEGELPGGETAPDQKVLQPVGFYSLEEPMPQALQRQKTIGAVVHQTQTLEPGATILLRLADAITVNGLQLPKGQLVYGAATLDRERLKIGITNIHYGNDLIPVRLHAYDLDGIEGMYIPGIRNKDAAKGTTQRAVQGLSLNTFGLSPGVQAAGVGVEAAKNLIYRKVKAVRVTVQQGYQLLLKNE